MYPYLIAGASALLVFLVVLWLFREGGSDSVTIALPPLPPKNPIGFGLPAS
jgi:hypothetical protein